MKNSINYLIPKVGNLLLETAFLNGSALYLEYDNGVNSHQILFEMSKKLPRRKKKYIRKLVGL